MNLDNGHIRDNKSWVIGRLLRDLESSIVKSSQSRDKSMRISIYDCLRNRRGSGIVSQGFLKIFGSVTMVVQLVAALPLILYGDWGVLLITAFGTCLALITGALPQWSTEKLACRTNSTKDFALTVGNGSNHIIIIRGLGNGLDLEDLAAAESPRSARMWDTPHSAWHRRYLFIRKMKSKSEMRAMPAKKVMLFNGLPLQLWYTRTVCGALSLLWLALLIAVSGLKSHTWVLLAVGALGMFQNAFTAGLERSPYRRNLPLLHRDTICIKKVMDALMDLEVTFAQEGKHFGQRLLPEFFPGGPLEEETAWWKGQVLGYDRKRVEEQEERGLPRTRMPKYNSAREFPIK